MLIHLAEALRTRGHEVLYVGPEDQTGWLGERLREGGFETAAFRIRRPVDPRCAAHLVRLIRRRRVDLVHSHEFSLAVYGALAAGIARLPHVITMHGGRYYAGRWRRRAALRWAFRHSRRVVAVSRATRTDLTRTLGVGPGGIRVVPNGVPPRPGSGEGVREELGIAGDEPLMLAVGSLYPVKGHAVLLEALGRLVRSRSVPPWRLAVAGRGGEEQRLRRRIEDEGLGGRVHLLGFRDDVGDLLAAADLFVMPSLSEGLPLALLEAMHAGTAIVASGVGGIPEAVTTGREAVLVPPGDPAALAAALASVLADRRLRCSLSEAARARARARFSVAAMTDAYERIYGWSPEPAVAVEEETAA